VAGSEKVHTASEKKLIGQLKELKGEGVPYLKIRREVGKKKKKSVMRRWVDRK